MCRYIITFFVSLLFTHITFSQVIRSGYVLNSDNTPIPYVNIGIIGKNSGTVSNEKGYYEIKINNEFFNDSIKFSSIGYKSEIFLVKDFINKSSNICLKDTLYEIPVVEIKPTLFRERRIGNRLRYGIPASYSVDLLGHELGIYVNVKGKSTLLKDFNFYLSQNNCDTLFFRLNVYKLKDSIPFYNVLNENIIITTTIKKGLVTIDLAKYNIILDEDFVISLEWIKHYNNNCIYFRTRPGISTVMMYSKQTSHGNWKMTKKIGVEFFVNVKQVK